MKHPWWLVGLFGCAALCTTYAVGSAEVGQSPAPHQGETVCDSMRLRLALKPERVRVETELSLSRTTGATEDLALHAAYASPGLPLAFDAQLVSATVPDSGLPIARPDALQTVASVRAPSAAALCVGSPVMAGRLIRVGHEALDRALARGPGLALRLRDVRALPPTDEQGVRELVLRLGRSGSQSIRLEAIEVKSEVELSLLQAETCGPSGKVAKMRVMHADQWAGEGEVPSRVRRDVRDDLCVRFRFAHDDIEREEAKDDAGAAPDGGANDAP